MINLRSPYKTSKQSTDNFLHECGLDWWHSLDKLIDSIIVFFLFFQSSFFGDLIHCADAFFLFTLMFHLSQAQLICFHFTRDCRASFSRFFVVRAASLAVFPVVVRAMTGTVIWPDGGGVTGPVQGVIYKRSCFLYVCPLLIARVIINMSNLEWSVDPQRSNPVTMVLQPDLLTIQQPSERRLDLQFFRVSCRRTTIAAPQ